MDEQSCPRTHRQQVPGFPTSRAPLAHHHSGAAQACTKQPKAHVLSPSHFPSAGRAATQSRSVLPEAREARRLPSLNSSIHLCLFCAQPTTAGSRGCQLCCALGTRLPTHFRECASASCFGEAQPSPPFSFSAMCLDFRGAWVGGGVGMRTGKTTSRMCMWRGEGNGYTNPALDPTQFHFGCFSLFFFFLINA